MTRHGQARPLILTRSPAGSRRIGTSGSGPGRSRSGLLLRRADVGNLARRQVRRHVGIAFLDQRAPRAGGGHVTEHGPLELRRAAALPPVEAGEHHLLPRSPGFAALVIGKLVTNTLSWITLRARVLHLEFASLNIAAKFANPTNGLSKKPRNGR